MDLSTYEGAKFELAQILRAVVSQAPKGCDAIERGAPELFARLAEDRFNLLVVGRFSRGKTSLMNAILGLDRLPTGLLPLTSVITSVGYGSREAVRIAFEGGGLAHEIPMAQLADYVTERGNPGNRRRVQMAHIALPAEILRRGIYFVDSPGLGSAILENSRTTQRFLPEADAVMLVSGFEAPLSEEEQQVIRSVSRSQRPLFLVLNKQDTVTVEARAEVKVYVQEHVASLVEGELPRIFMISARDALAAKLARRPNDLELSGVADLERELMRFLIEDKGRAFLIGLCDRAVKLLNAASIVEGARAELFSRLTELRGRFTCSFFEFAKSEEIQATSGSASRSARMGECTLCTAVRDGLFERLCQYQYDLAMHAEAGERLAEEGGLCGAHLRLYVSMATDRSVCVALTPLLRQLAAQLRNGTPETLIATRPRCSLCELQQSIEERVISAWLADTGETTAWEGACLPHLRKLVQLEPARLKAADLSRREAAAARLAEDMQRYVLKYDGIRRGLTTEEETEAARRVVSFVAGHRTLVAER